MTHLHIFTEEPSIKIVFDNILPQILPKNITYSIYPHQGKQDLEKTLSKTIPTISKIPGSRILITRDQDNGDCYSIKKNIQDIIGNSCSCPLYIRIVCKELEAWFLGDLEAVKKAYPRFNPSLYTNKQQFKNVDKITSPSKILLKILPEYSKRDTLPKLEVSENISKYLKIDETNKSPSYIATIKAIENLIIEN